MNDTNYQSSVKKRENLNGTISVTEIEFVVKNFSTKNITNSVLTLLENLTEKDVS